MRAAGCWKQTPGLLFSEEKSYCKGGRRLLRLGKRPVDASWAETQKEGHLTDVLLFWKGRLKLIFPLNETAAQRCELALTYKKSEQAIQSLLRRGRSVIIGLGKIQSYQWF